ncbi:hypothetical protein ACOBQX_22505 [Actinokineospora sp. G85]|uniref:hypothetical protein n=1 Tax=Actinokineospora sp. G85 TaxID=3406626 RepID=UPI003C73796B
MKAARRAERPRNRMELYAKALSMLLHLRDAERGIDTPVDDTAERGLPHDAAWRLTQAGKVDFVHRTFQEISYRR